MERHRLTKDCTKILLDKIHPGLPRGRNMRGLCSTSASAPGMFALSGNWKLPTEHGRLLTNVKNLCVQVCWSDCQSYCVLGLRIHQVPGRKRSGCRHPEVPDDSRDARSYWLCRWITHSHQRTGRNDADFYRCRKGYFSINLQGICDADLKFMNIIARWPGSVHDSRNFENSHVCQYPRARKSSWILARRQWAPLSQLPLNTCPGTYN